MKKEENHILIIWPKSIKSYSLIKKEVLKKFQIKEEYHINIKKNSSTWIDKFYDRSLADFNKNQRNKIIRDKKKQIGTGKAIILLLSTESLKYEHLNTTRGVCYVNTVCIETKKSIRSLIKSDIHLSDSLSDSLENQIHIADIINRKIENKYDHKNTIIDFYQFLNTNHIKYINMRGHNFILENIDSLIKKENDIDILVEDSDTQKLLEYPFLSKDTKDKDERYTLSFFNNSKYHTCKIDIYTSGSGIIPSSLGKKILSDFQIFNNIRIPTSLDSELLDLYHFVFHKRHIPKDKVWGEKSLYNIQNKTSTQVLSILENFGINEIIKNPYYPTWGSFHPNSILNRNIIQKRIQTILKDTQYYSYVFENTEGNIEKEGYIKNILNEYLIIKELSSELKDIIPNPLDIYTDDKYDFGILIMSKIKGLPFKQITREILNFDKFKKYIESSLKTIEVFKKHKIKHRDINPTNLFFHNGDIIFIDFGWSIIDNNSIGIETPIVLNDGYRKSNNEHDDLYSIMKCFESTFSLPRFLNKILLSGDLQYIHLKINKLRPIQILKINIFLKNQKIITIILKVIRKFKKIKQKILKHE